MSEYERELYKKEIDELKRQLDSALATLKQANIYMPKFDQSEIDIFRKAYENSVKRSSENNNKIEIVLVDGGTLEIALVDNAVIKYVKQ